MGVERISVMTSRTRDSTVIHYFTTTITNMSFFNKINDIAVRLIVKIFNQTDTANAFADL